MYNTILLAFLLLNKKVVSCGLRLKALDFPFNPRSFIFSKVISNRLCFSKLYHTLLVGKARSVKELERGIEKFQRIVRERQLLGNIRPHYKTFQLKWGDKHGCN